MSTLSTRAGPGLYTPTAGTNEGSDKMTLTASPTNEAQEVGSVEQCILFRL